MAELLRDAARKRRILLIAALALSLIGAVVGTIWAAGAYTYNSAVFAAVCALVLLGAHIKSAVAGRIVFLCAFAIVTGVEFRHTLAAFGQQPGGENAMARLVAARGVLALAAALGVLVMLITNRPFVSPKFIMPFLSLAAVTAALIMIYETVSGAMAAGESLFWEVPEKAAQAAVYMFMGVYFGEIRRSRGD
ncbi:MAG: hypothetical protein LBR85_00945 [Oscillospiraceae bacterium]|jgi:hypothetical protein|nr:hypothetical protein [Oscillospiraceae bacterium]